MALDYNHDCNWNLAVCPIVHKSIQSQNLRKNTMRTQTIALFMCSMIPLPLAITPLPAQSASQKTITVEQVNGTWKKNNGVFRIWAVGKQKLRIEFQGTYEFQSQAGPMANTGYGKGTADIIGNRIVFKPDDAEAACKINMIFSNKKLTVQQDSDCGFGMNVSSAGTYTRTNSQKPEFSNLASETRRSEDSGLKALGKENQPSASEDTRKQECNSIIEIHNTVVAQSTNIFKQKPRSTSAYKEQMQQVAEIHKKGVSEMASVQTKDEKLKAYRNRFASLYRDSAAIINQIIPMIGQKNRQQQIAKKLAELSNSTRIEKDLVNDLNNYCSQP